MGALRQRVSERPESIDRLRATLERLEAFYGPDFLESDPLKFPHRYPEPLDRELVAFLSALFAFGNVKAFVSVLETLFRILGPRPVLALRSKVPPKVPSSLRYRWVTSNDIRSLLSGLGALYRKGGSLKSLFLEGFDPTAPDVHKAVCGFAKALREHIPPTTRGLSFLIAKGEGGGPLKRYHLFLRWVVRRPSPDLGLWTEVSPAQLLFPVDTHVAQTAFDLGLLKSRTVSHRTPRELTTVFRLLSPEDPVKFDFALARAGIVGDCRHREDPQHCPRCLLVDLCRPAAP